MTKKGAAIPGQFNWKMEFYTPVPAHTTFVYDLEDDFGFTWGGTSTARSS